LELTTIRGRDKKKDLWQSGNETMKLIIAIFVLLLISLAAAPNEATGRATHVVDGDTFDVQIQDHDSRITEDFIRITLAGMNSPAY
jgi:hypothetical protein